MMTMEQLAKRIDSPDTLVAAKAAAEARARFAAGETEGCKGWYEWLARHCKREKSRVARLVNIGKAKDPEAAVRDDREWRAQASQRHREKRASTEALLERAKQKLVMPARPGVRNPADLERQVSNLVTVWNNSEEPARARFLARLGVKLQVVETDAA